MDRRTFVKASGLGVAGAAGMAGLAGAAATFGARAALADEAAETTGTDETAEAQQPGQDRDTPAWLGSEPQIADDQIVATYDCDILIVGAGNGGLAAAAKASELGLNFICCEKGECVTETREYLGAVNTSLSEGVGEPVDTMKLLNEISRYASGKCDRDLIKLWIDNCGEMIDWVIPMMDEAGKEAHVDNPQSHETGGTDYYLPVMEHSWNVTYTQPMRDDVVTERLEEEGDGVFYSHELVRLIHEDGAVKGGFFSTENGYVRVNAPYTVLATGGYPANPDMMMALQPDTIRNLTAASYNGLDDGSGIKAALWAGAAKQNDPTPMIFDRGVVMPGTDAGYAQREDGSWALPGTVYQLNLGSQPFLKVNRNGRRFANESTPYDSMAFAAARQPGGVFCSVMDGNAAEDIKRFAMVGCAALSRISLTDLGMSFEEMIASEYATDFVMKADTLDELADKLGFEGEDKETFLATCERQNELFDMQEDPDFGKEAYRITELRTPPFYGAWFGASLLTTLDGIQVNAQLQALDADYEPVPGLYAVGDCSGGFFDTNYPEYMPGLAAGRTVTQGRQVVKMIAESEGFAPTERTWVRPEEPEIDVATLHDGTYAGTAHGMGGDITVTLEVKGGVISVQDIGPNYETPTYGGYVALNGGLFAEQVEEAQSWQIDGVSGASVTSAAVRVATRRALKRAAMG